MATIQINVSDRFLELLKHQRKFTNETQKGFILRNILVDLVTREALSSEEAKHWYCYEMGLPYTPPPATAASEGETLQ